MIIEQKFQQMYAFTCHNCHTRLLLDDSDFVTKEIIIGQNRLKSTRISTPCPVCGRLWDNVEKTTCRVKMVPIE